MRINSVFFKYFIYIPITILRGEYPGFILKHLLKSQYDKPDQIYHQQEEKFLALIRHAKNTTPYYQERIPDNLTSLADITKIPLLDKETIRKNYQQFCSRKFCGLKRSKTTGGSTGAPVTILKNNFGMANELAATWRGYHWAGIDIGEKQARFWGIPLDKKGRLRAKLIDFVTNRIRFSAFSFSESDMQVYSAMIRSKKPVYFYGYVSMIKQFAQYIERNRSSSMFNIKSIVTTSEVLTSADRNYISTIFNCPVYNEYGCGEIGTIAHECRHGKLHISAENMIVEIIDKNGVPAKAGEIGEITVTDLTNYSMPLIRYRMKDFGSLSNEKCSCGVALPILTNIYGREYDMLKNSAGKTFHGEFFLYMVEDAKKSGIILNAFQLEQKALNQLVIRVVSNDDHFLAFKEFIVPKIQKEFDRNVSISFENIQEIPRETSGKLRVIKGLQ